MTRRAGILPSACEKEARQRPTRRTHQPRLDLTKGDMTKGTVPFVMTKGTVPFVMSPFVKKPEVTREHSGTGEGDCRMMRDTAGLMRF